MLVGVRLDMKTQNSVWAWFVTWKARFKNEYVKFENLSSPSSSWVVWHIYTPKNTNTVIILLKETLIKRLFHYDVESVEINNLNKNQENISLQRWKCKN